MTASGNISTLTRRRFEARPETGLASVLPHPASLPLGLHVLIQVDTDLHAATVVVRGFLTATNCDQLLRVIARTSTLARGLRITVDLSAAQAVDTPALSRLRAYPAWTLLAPAA